MSSMIPLYNNLMFADVIGSLKELLSMSEIILNDMDDQSNFTSMIITMKSDQIGLTKQEIISRGFDFMKHCFRKDFCDLPYFLIPIDD